MVFFFNGTSIKRFRVTFEKRKQKELICNRKKYRFFFLQKEWWGVCFGCFCFVFFSRTPSNDDPVFTSLQPYREWQFLQELFAYSHSCFLKAFSRTCISIIADKFKEGAVSVQKAGIFHQACFRWVLNSTWQVWKYRKDPIPFRSFSDWACKLKQYFQNYLNK